MESFSMSTNSNQLKLPSIRNNASPKGSLNLNSNSESFDTYIDLIKFNQNISKFVEFFLYFYYFHTVMLLIYQIYFRIETQIKSNEPFEADLLNVKNEFIKIIVNTLTNNK